MRTSPQPVALTLLTRVHPGRQTEILLGLKQRGFGAGNIVAPGGKIEPGEQPVSAAARELFEETGYRVADEDLAHVATVRFRFPAQPGADMDCQVFQGTVFGGELTPSLELAPRWWPVDRLPTAQMWQDAAQWLPRIIAGERFTATVRMAADNLRVDRIDYLPWS